MMTDTARVCPTNPTLPLQVTAASLPGRSATLLQRLRNEGRMAQASLDLFAESCSGNWALTASVVGGMALALGIGLSQGHQINRTVLPESQRPVGLEELTPGWTLRR